MTVAKKIFDALLFFKRTVNIYPETRRWHDHVARAENTVERSKALAWPSAARCAPPPVRARFASS
jgi:hypothetical protein